MFVQTELSRLYYLSWSQVDVHNFCSRLHRLGDVHVHLIPVEVGVVRTRVAQVHSERRPRQHLHSVTHHTHFMERRLAIEDDVVAIVNVTFDLKSM